jgi:uncharacterized membrane protein
MSTAEPAPYRVDPETLRKDAPVFLLIALDLAFGLVALGRMPPRVPIHWGASGEVNGWGPSWVNAFLPPGIAILLYLTFLFIPLIDPQHRNYAAFSGALRALRLLVVGFLVFVHVLVVLASLGVGVPMDAAMRAGLPLLFAGIVVLVLVPVVYSAVLFKRLAP